MVVVLQVAEFVKQHIVDTLARRCHQPRVEGQSARWGPTAIDARVLDAARDIAGEQVSQSVAYRVAGQLELVADMMDETSLIKLRGRWLHGLKKPMEGGSRISEEAIAARQEKLPSAAAIRAIAGIFNEAQGVPAGSQ